MHKQSRNQELDGLRGIAAMCVALGHCVTNAVGYDVWTKSIIDFPDMTLAQIVGRLGHVFFPADAAVIIFFVLSGYVLWNSILRRDANLIAVIPYMISRFYRLLPVVLVSAILLAFIMPATGEDVARNALLLSSNMNGVQWSLQVELLASLFLFIVFLVVRKKLLLISAVVVSLGIYLTILYKVHFPLFFIPFLLGISLHYLSGRWFQVSLIFIGAYIALISADLFLQRNPISHCVCFIAAWIIVGAIIHRKFKFLRSTIPQFLGKISYAFYLSHLSATLLTKKFILFLELSPSNQFITFLALALFSISIAIPLSWLIHVFIEKPGMEAGVSVVKSVNQWFQKRSTVEQMRQALPQI